MLWRAPIYLWVLVPAALAVGAFALFQLRRRAALLRAFADARPLSPRGVKEALERVKMLPAASGAPGTMLRFGTWSHRAWMGAGYLVARRLDPDGINSHLVARFGQD